LIASLLNMCFIQQCADPYTTFEEFSGHCSISASKILKCRLPIGILPWQWWRFQVPHICDIGKDGSASPSGLQQMGSVILESLSEGSRNWSQSSLWIKSSRIVLGLISNPSSGSCLAYHQKNIPFARNSSVSLDGLRQSDQRHLGGGLLSARRQYNASRCVSPSNRCFTVSSRSVGLLF
jgi:hypothetical protein